MVYRSLVSGGGDVENGQHLVERYRRECEAATCSPTMRLRRYNATLRHPLRRLLPLLVALLAFQRVVGAVEIQIIGTPYNEKPSDLRPFELFRKSLPDYTAMDYEPAAAHPLRPDDIIPRLASAAALRDNILSSIRRILLLRLDEESRISFEIVYDVIHSGHMPTYELLPILPIIHQRIPRQQLYSVMQILERIGSRYVSSYASICKEALSDGRVNMELAPPMNLLSGIENATIVSLAIDRNRRREVPLTLGEALNVVTSALTTNRLELNLYVCAVIMLNLPNFDLTNPEVPDSIRFVSDYMIEHSRRYDPLFEYISPDRLESADRLIKTILQKMEVATLPSPILRETVSLLLQNFDVKRKQVLIPERNAAQLFDIVVPDFYPEHVVYIAKFLKDSLDSSTYSMIDISHYNTRTQALVALLTQIQKKVSLPAYMNESVSALLSFVAQHQREEETQSSSAPVSFYSVIKYLNAFRIPCGSEKLRSAEETLRPLLTEDLPWSYAFGDRRSGGNPRELLVGALINLRNTYTSKELAMAIDNFIYQAQISGTAGKPSILYELGIIFQREDSTEVELDLYSLLARVPNVFSDERFIPLITFLAKPNIFDYLGHEFNKFAHNKPRELLLALVNRAIAIPAVSTDDKLLKALQVTKISLQEPTLINKYTSDDLQSILKLLPGIESDPRYLPLKLLFKKKNLFKHISPTFSLAGLNSPIENIALILNTVSLKPIDARLLESIKFSLSNIEGPPLPARSFNREDFVYLTNQLFSHNKKLELDILKSPVHRKVGEWNIGVSGTPENVLSRALSYPTIALSRNAEVSRIVEEAEKSLEEETWQEVELLTKKTLNGMLEYLPDTSNFRPVNLLLKKANLAMFVPKLNVTTLNNEQPKEALIILLENLISSAHIRSEALLSRRLTAALHSARKSTTAPSHDISSNITEMLMNPLDPKYKPLWQEFRFMNNATTILDNRRVSLKESLLLILAESKDEKLKRAAELALREIAYGEDSGLIPVMERQEILSILSLLPSSPEVDPLRQLLTPSWISDILPQGFRKSDYASEDQLLRVILYMTKQRADVANNPLLMNALFHAEKALGGWEADVEPLKEMVIAVKNAVYEPVKELLSATNLNKMNIHFSVNPENSPRQSLLILLNRLILHPNIKRDIKVLLLLDAVKQDVLNFGVDLDLISVLDDAGVLYTPGLSPLRQFLHENQIGNRLGPLVFQTTDRRQQFQILLELLRVCPEVNSDRDLLDAVRMLGNIDVGMITPLGTTVFDLMDILNTIPRNVLEKYTGVQKLFATEILEQLTQDDEIIRSEQPLTTLLMNMAHLPNVMQNATASAQIIGLYKELRGLDRAPLITGFQLRPLIRELYHVQQYNIEYVSRILNPNILSVFLPDHPEDSDDDADFLGTILREILSQPVITNNEDLKTQLLSIERDLELITGPIKSTKGGLFKEDIEQILALIPNNKEYDPIRHLITTNVIFEHIPKTINWKGFPKPETKLTHILDFVESYARQDEYLYQSVRGLNLYLTEKFNFITEEDVENIRSALNKLPVDYDLVPLKLFLTHENLVKYIPQTFSYKEYDSPKKALAEILAVLNRNTKLKRRIELQKTIMFARKALREDQRGSGTSEITARKTLPQFILTANDLKFIQILDIESPVLKNIFHPEHLMKILPNTFSLAQQPTFKTKTLHLLKYLLENEPEAQSELQELLSIVEGFPDTPKIAENDVAQLIEAVPTRGIQNMNLVTKYLKTTRLMKLLPGNFKMNNEMEVKKNLHEVIRMLSYNIGNADKRTMKAFANLLEELDKPTSLVIPKHANVNPDELSSLISEIPFKKMKEYRELQKTLTENQIITKLPLNFDLEMYNTRKLRLLAILEQLNARSDDLAMTEFLKFAVKLVNDMPDAPKINNVDIRNLLTTMTLNPSDLDVLLHNCQIDILIKYLPIKFNLKKVNSYKKKIMTIIGNCKKNNFKDIGIRQALANAELLAKRLPNFDLSKKEIIQIVDEVTCGNFTKLKPLKTFVYNNDLLPLLTPNLNLETQHTMKQKLIGLIKALRNIKRFQNEEMFDAFDAAERAAHSMANTPTITAEDIVGLKELPVFKERRSLHFSNVFTLGNILKVIPTTFNIQDYTTNESKLATLLNYADNIIAVKSNDGVRDSLKFVKNTLTKEAEKEVLSLMESMIDEGDEYLPLKLHLLSTKNKFFQPITTIPHGYEYPKTEERLRVVLKAIANIPRAMQSKTLLNTIEALISKLSVGAPTEYEIDEAIDEIGDSMKYHNLKTYFRCTDVRKQFKNLVLTADHSPKRLLLDMLNVAKTSPTDEEILTTVERLIVDVQRSVWDSEAEELFKQLPNFKEHAGRLEAVRSYFILHGPTMILGEDYHQKLPVKLDRLKMLSEKLLELPDLDQRHDLKVNVEYLREILTSQRTEVKETTRSPDEINIKALFAALPKTRNEMIILGILKFFSDPQLLSMISLPKNPFEYKYKGPLLQAIIENGIELESVQQDVQQQEALEFFRDKIIMTGPGAQPIELKNFAKHSTMKIDLIGLLKAIDIQAVNVSVATKVAIFFDTQYDGLIHGLGFDQAPYKTRGTYLKAFIEHLIVSPSVPNEVKRNAKLLIPAVRFDGSGAEAIDINEEIIPDNRMFGDEYYPGYSPPYAGPMYIEPPTTLETPLARLHNLVPAYLKNDLNAIFSHFHQQPQFIDRWNIPITNEVTKITPVNPPWGVKPLEYISRKLPHEFEANRARIMASVDRILDSTKLDQRGGVSHRRAASKPSRVELATPRETTPKSSPSEISITRPMSFVERIKKYMEDEDEDEFTDDEYRMPKNVVKKQHELQDKIRRTLNTMSRTFPRIDVQGRAFGFDRQRSRADDHRRSRKRTKQDSAESATFNPGKVLLDQEKILQQDDVESATFSPDKVLFNVNDKISQNPYSRLALGDIGGYITEEEAEKLRKKKKNPVKPLPVHPDELPKAVNVHESVPHKNSKSSQKINLESRKLFVRDDPDPIDETSDEELKNQEGKTVKKDLAKEDGDGNPVANANRVLTEQLEEESSQKHVSHNISKSPQTTNQESVKLVIHDDPDPTDETSVEELKKQEGKTVKKDLTDGDTVTNANRMLTDQLEEKGILNDATQAEPEIRIAPQTTPEVTQNGSISEPAKDKNEDSVAPVSRIHGGNANEESTTTDVSQHPIRTDNDTLLEPAADVKIDTANKTVDSDQHTVKRRDVSRNFDEGDGIPSLSPHAVQRIYISKRDTENDPTSEEFDGKSLPMHSDLVIPVREINARRNDNDEEHLERAFPQFKQSDDGLFQPDLPSISDMYSATMFRRKRALEDTERGVSSG